MAIGNYGKALGQMARESVTGAVKGFGMGIKGAAMREMPAVTALYGFSREVKSRADKLSANAAVEAVREQKVNNVISLEMVRQLKSINNSVSLQARMMNQQQQAERQRMQFAEESERENNARNRELVSAIKGLKGGGAYGGSGSPSGDGGGGGGGGFLSTLLGAGLGEILGIAGAAGGGWFGAKKILGMGGPRGARAARGPSRLSRLGGAARAAGKMGRWGRLARIAGAGGRIIGGGLSGPAGWALAGLSAYELYQLMFGGDSSSRPGGGLFSSQGGQEGPYAKGDPFDRLSQRQRELYYLRKNKVPGPKRQTSGASTSGAPSSNLADRIIQAESGGKNIGTSVLDAKGKPTSTAFGIGQMTKGTFEGLMARAKPGDAMYDYTNGSTTPPMKKGSKTFEQFRQDVAFQRICLNALITANKTQLEKRGIQANDANLYLAHFLGAGGAEKVLSASDNTSLANVIGGDALKANPDLFGGPGKPAKLKTVADLKRWASAKMALTGAQVASGGGGAGGTGGGAGGGGGDDKDAKKIDSLAKGTTLASVSNAQIGAIPSAPIQVTSGSPGENKPIQVEDKGANAKLKTIAKGAVLDAKLGVANYKYTQKQARAEQARRTSRVETPEQKILRQANERFLKSFQNTTANLLGKEIYKAMTVGFYGKEGSNRLVSKQQASGQMFRGTELASLFNLRGKSEKLLTSLFGKDIAKAYAPMVAQLGTAYLEVGARFAGRGLFSGAGFSDKDSDALTGQILGNFRRGNKQAATEQLLYGMTGIASGPESIFFKYGFSSSQQGSNFLGQMGASAITAPIAGMMGGPQPTYRDPRTGQIYGAGQYPQMGSTTLNTPGFNPAGGQAGGYYSAMSATGKDTRYVNPQMMQLALDADKAARDALPHIKQTQWDALDQAKQATKEADKQYLESKAGTDEYRVAQEAREQAAVREQQITNEILRSKPTAVGGGSSAGGMFMSNLGNFAFDLGASMVANKLTSGIKNPYLRALGNFALVSGANTFIKPALASALGFSAPAGAAATASAAGGGVGLMDAASGIGGAFMSSAPGIGVASTIGANLTRAGYTAAGDFMTGVQVGMNNFSGAASTATGQMVAETAGTSWAATAGTVVGEVLPYTAAIIKAVQGDFIGAATTAAGTYIGAAIGNMILPGIGGLIGGALGSIAGSFLGGLFGGGHSSPAYKSIQRLVRVGGNNDPTQRVTTMTGNGPPAEYTQFCDALLTGGFNAAKLIERVSGLTFPYDYIGVYVHQKHGVRIRLFKQGDDLGAGGSKELNLGGVSNFNVPKALSSMATWFKDLMSEGKDAEALKKLDYATKLVKSHGASTLTKGVLRELTPGGKYALDQSVAAGIYHESATMSKKIEDYYNGLQAHAPTGGRQYDYEGGYTDSPRMVWSFKENKYVEAPSVEKTIDTDYGQQKITTYDDTVIGIDENGNPIFNYQGNVKTSAYDDGITISDLQKHASTVYPNFVEPAPSGTTTPTAVTPTYNYEKGGPLQSKQASVAVVGSNNTNTDNSTNVTNVNQVSATSDPWRTNTTNAGMPLVA